MQMHRQIFFYLTRITIYYAVSGLSGSKETAQDQVLIGMGLLAGSTVMLLTVLWGSCIVVGKVGLSDASARIDGRDSNRCDHSGPFLPFISIFVWSKHLVNLQYLQFDVLFK